MGPTDADGSGMLRQGGIRPALGFLWEPPREPDHLVHRAEPLAALVRALRARTPVVAVTGPAGVGKSTLAAQACRDRQVRRAFRDGITWLAAGPGRDPAALLAALAGQLGLAQAAAGYAAVDAARDELARALRGKRMLIVLDDVTEQAALDACAGLAAECAVLCTTRLTGPPGSAHLVHVPLGPLTEQQAQELLSHWTGPDPAGPGAGRALCDRVGRVALGVAVAGGMTRDSRSIAWTLASIGAPVWPDGSAAGPPPAGGEDPGLHRSLLGAIEAAVADLPEPARDRYQQLAVFAGRGPFPAEAAQALWPSGLAWRRARPGPRRRARPGRRWRARPAGGIHPPGAAQPHRPEPLHRP